MNSPQTLYLLVPCYNEEEILPQTSKLLSEKIESFINEGLITSQSRIVFIDDGSKDMTWSIISDLHNQNPIVSGIRLSRNRGHQNALLAGLMTVKDICDFTISLDADLQDDIGVLKDFIQKYYEGNEIVYGVRSSRKTDSFFKRCSAESFYKQMNEAGFDARIYVNTAESIFGPTEYYHDYFSNIEPGSDVSYTIDFARLCKCFVQISGYSFSPYLAKHYFFYSFDFSDQIVQKKNYPDPSYQDMCESRSFIVQKKKS